MPPRAWNNKFAKALAATLDTRLIRLQCYEGLDAAQALYEWDYPRQLLEIRVQEAAGASTDSLRDNLYSDSFLLERPLLAALRVCAAWMLDQAEAHRRMGVVCSRQCRWSAACAMERCSCLDSRVFWAASILQPPL